MPTLLTVVKTGSGEGEEEAAGGSLGAKAICEMMLAGLEDVEVDTLDDIEVGTLDNNEIDLVVDGDGEVEVIPELGVAKEEETKVEVDVAEVDDETATTPIVVMALVEPINVVTLIPVLQSQLPTAPPLQQ